MTISTTTNRASYAGNGVTVAFSFGYAFLTTADLVVILKNDSTGVETVKTITTHYAVSGTTDSDGHYPNGGTVTMVTAPAVGETLIIYRDLARTQDLNIANLDSFPARSMEKRLDKMAMWVQRLYELVRHAPKFTEGSATFDIPLPEPSASKMLGWNAGATAIVNYPNFDAIGVTGTRASPTNITAGGGITPGNTYSDETIFIQGSGAAVDISANPQIAAGTTVGQKLRLIGRSSVNTVLLEDGTGCSLNGAWLAEADSVITLLWDGTNWVEIARR
jgi:hypothetical protein